MTNLFDLTGRVAAITGGAGLMGMQHAEVIAAHGGIPVLVDVTDAQEKAADLAKRHSVTAAAYRCNITQPGGVEELLKEILARFGRLDILINNAANNPKMESSSEVNFSRLENFPIAAVECRSRGGLDWRASLQPGDGQLHGTDVSRMRTARSNSQHCIGPGGDRSGSAYLPATGSAGAFAAGQAGNLLRGEERTGRTHPLSCHLLGRRGRPGKCSLPRWHLQRATRGLRAEAGEPDSDGTDGPRWTSIRARCSFWSRMPRLI